MNNLENKIETKKMKWLITPGLIVITAIGAILFTTLILHPGLTGNVFVSTDNLTTTQNETINIVQPISSWMQYNNPGYGISFKLPQKAYINGSLVDVTVKNIDININCDGFYANAIKNGDLSKCDDKNPFYFTDTTVNGQYIFHLPEATNACNDPTIALTREDKGVIQILGIDFKVISYIAKSERRECDYGLIEKVKKNNDDCDYKVPANPGRRFTCIQSINLTMLQDSATQRGISNTSIEFLKSLKYSG